MAAEVRRVDVGFQGGHSLSLRMTETEYGKLRKAASGDGWHDVKTQDSEVAVDLSQVVYVRLATEEHKVGF